MEEGEVKNDTKYYDLVNIRRCIVYFKDYVTI